ncbi:MAG: DUF2339 domain-containing protein, partial [Planctomycetaceae bacterium]|nr:DUF2339 domain-containing protein [Planctomycetaceae bacterium]
ERRMVWGAVWVGAIALVMAGVYLVKEAIESGWLGPTVRTVMTAGAGILALGIGEYLRRTQKQIAHGVTAAGVSLLYAALIGATTLHHLIPDSLGVVCMVGITALAVGLSLRHGPFVALLGLLGGFIMPKLLSTDSSSALQLFSYLIVLQVGLIAVTRYRGWYWLMFGTFLGGVVWSLLWILFVYQAADAHYVALFLMISTLAFLFGVPNALTAFSDERRNPVSLLLPWLTVLTAMGLFVVLIGKTNFSTTEWCYFGLLGAGCIVLARIQPRYMLAPVLSCILSVDLIWVWQTSGIEERLADFLWICTGLGSIYGVGAYIALWRSSRPEFWGWLSAVGGLAFLFIARYSVPTAQNWDWILLGVAGAYGAAAIPLIHRREKPAFGEALAALIIAATAGVAFSIQFALESHEIRWIWVGWCWALLLPVISGLMCRLKLRRLADLLVIVSFASSILLLLNQEVFEEDFGSHPIFNRLWLLYGIPLVSGLASRFLVGRGSEGGWLEKDYRRGLVGWLELFCVFMSFALTTLLVRHGFNPEFTFRGTMRLLEMGLYANVWLVLAIVLRLLGRQGETLIPSWTALFIGWGAIGAMFLVATSLWGMIQLERTVTPDWSFPVLFFVFWVPAVLVFVFGELFNRDAREVPQRTLLEAAAWCLGLLALAVTIRRGFHVTPTDAFPNWWELTTYPLIWGVLALTIMGIGLSLGRQWTRQIGEWLLLGAGAAYVLIVYVAWNPIWTHIDIGEMPIANGVLYAFGGMVALGLVSMKILDRCGNRGAVITAGVFSQVAIFLLV